MTDVNVIESYISYLVKTKKSSSNTLAAYKRDLDVFCSFLAQSKISLLKASSENLSQFKEFPN
jgi:site-specific recombinase XerD